MIDYNFADGSSTVLEADYFGIYSFLHGNGGTMNYRNLLESGRVDLISSMVTNYEELSLGNEGRYAKIEYF